MENRDESEIYTPKEYWTSLANRTGSSDVSGFAPILHPLAPPWFNQYIDDLQFRAVRRALALAALPPGARLLDVGCGTGRWVRRYRELGFSPMGVDATIGMLQVARQHGSSSPLSGGLAQNLPFSDAAFDCLSDITVVQHIPYEFQPVVFREMVRVLKPGGRMVLMEVICRADQGTKKDPHVFPKKPSDWISQVEQAGVCLIEWFGQEFLLADRLFVSLTQSLTGRKDNLVNRVQSSDGPSSGRESSLAKRIYWHLRHITVPVSVWSENATAKICPPSLATHGVFVFRKPQ